MKPENIKERVAKLLAGDSVELSRLARDLGHELPRKRLKTLNEFRATLAGFIADGGHLSHDEFHKMCLEAVNKFRAILGEPISVEGEYVLGYLTALCDVTAAYSAAIEPEEQDEKSMSFLLEQGLEPVMLALLSNQPKPLDQLDKVINTFHPSQQISREKIGKDLELLMYNWLVTDLTDGLGGTFYQLTLRGEKLAKQLLERRK